MRLQNLLSDVVRYSLMCSLSSMVMLSGVVLPSYAQRAAAQTAELTAADPTSQINVRLQPSIASASPHYGLVGDRVEVLNQTTGRDGFTWYYVRFSRPPQAEGWVRGDFLRVPGATEPSVIASRPPQAERVARQQEATVVSQAVTAEPETPVVTSSRSDLPTVSVQRNFGDPVPPRTIYAQESEPVEPQYEQTAPGPSASESVSIPIRVIGPDPSTYRAPAYTPPSRPAVGGPATTSYVAPPARFTADQVNYFLEVALGSEFGSSNGTVRKWNGPITVRVHGQPTNQDLQTLQSVISEINQLADGIEMQLTRGAATGRTGIDIHFAPESQFRQLESNYRPRNLGFFWTWWDNNDVITRANILISTTGVSQDERSHLIREELTQSLGLMRDSRRYRDSIFYQGWTAVTRYSDIDRAAIALLYRPEIRAGMNRSQVMSAVQRLGEGQRLTAQPGWSQIQAIALGSLTEVTAPYWQPPYYDEVPYRPNARG